MNSCTIYSYRKHSVVTMVDEIKNDLFSYDPDAPNEWKFDGIDTQNINVGSVAESVTVSYDPFITGTPDMFDSVYDYLELKKKYPALQQAWDHYQSVLNMCKLKEAENNAD